MQNSYLAICYVCNENCLFCPCSKTDKKNKMITPIEDLKITVDEMAAKGTTDITISGGEPTLHPEFIELIKYIQNIDIQITVLSNVERFSDELFANVFVKNINTKKIKFITTLHSNIREEHEKANQTVGSFDRTLRGLKNLSQNKYRVIVKHCITKSNYRDLRAFYTFCDDFFDENIDVQLCSIDYYGIPKEKLLDEKLSFMEIKPFLEEMFDYYIERKNEGSIRNLYCINMPLCSCDIFYWSYIPIRRKKMYNSYKDPHQTEISQSNDNVGICENICNICKVSSICCGTYNTAFENFGDEIVQPYI